MVKYEPIKWNKNKHITHSHNCYSYFLNKISPVEELRCKAIEQKLGSTNKCKTPQPGYSDGLNERLYKQIEKQEVKKDFAINVQMCYLAFGKTIKIFNIWGMSVKLFTKSVPIICIRVH